MEPKGPERRLSAILVADVAGYARLMGRDEGQTVRRLKEYRQVFSARIAQSRGRIVNAPGDSILAEFSSVVDAVGCAVEIQRDLAEKNAQLPDDRRMRFRIGLNIGDVIVEEDAIYGDGINVAARLEALAEPGGICVSGMVHDAVKGKLDLAFEPMGEQTVKNIAEPVRAYRVGIGAPGEHGHAGAPPSSAPIRETPSIAVLPFNNMGGDPEQEYFSDGITEEIITQLTRIRRLHVIARNSTFQYKGQAVDVRQVGRDLGARYMLEGSVRRSGGRIRITAQLLDAHDGAHLWAETYDRDLSSSDVFAIQDDITARIVGTIADTYGILSRAGLEEGRTKGASSLDAYDWVLRTHAYYRDFSQEEHLRIREGLERAVEQDPGYADAWAWLAAMYRDEFQWGYNPRPNPIERAEQAVRRALELDPMNQEAHLVLAHVHFHRGEMEAFVIQAERLVELYPQSADAHGAMAVNLVLAGHVERGLDWAAKATALNPNFPGWINVPFYYAHYLDGKYEEALNRALKMNMPRLPGTHVMLAAVYGQLGREKEAQLALANLSKLKPVDEVIELFRSRWKHKPLREAMFDGLRKAGLEIPDED